MKKLICCAITLLMSATMALAENDIITSLDTNHDAMVSPKEATPVPELFSQFKDLDQNKDGQLDAKEIMAFKKKA